MTENDGQVELLEKIIVKMKDIHNSYVALVQKMAELQLEASEGGVESILDTLSKPFTNASDNAVLFEEALKEVEIERNRIKNEG